MVCTGVLIMTEQYYYSYSAKGFFWLSEDELEGNDIPADLIPFGDEEHAALFLGQERGKYINHTPDGPVWLTSRITRQKNSLRRRKAKSHS